MSNKIKYGFTALIILILVLSNSLIWKDNINQKLLLGQSDEEIDILLYKIKLLEERNDELEIECNRRIMRDFNSVNELKIWLNNDNTNKLNLSSCKEYARTLVRHGGQDYYYIFYQGGFVEEWNNLSTYNKMHSYSRWIYIKGKLQRRKMVDLNWLSNHGHSYNFVIINNTIWFIEPQTDNIYEYQKIK